MPFRQLYFHGELASITFSLGTISTCAPKVLTNWTCGSKVNRYGNVTLKKMPIHIYTMGTWLARVKIGGDSLKWIGTIMLPMWPTTTLAIVFLLFLLSII
jgi:hypothetical protein